METHALEAPGHTVRANSAAGYSEIFVRYFGVYHGLERYFWGVCVVTLGGVVCGFHGLWVCAEGIIGVKEVFEWWY